MKAIGTGLQWIGLFLMVAGGAFLAFVIVAVMVNGSWPDVLRPVQSRFQLLSQFFGNFIIIVELAIFIGPGALIWLAGEKLLEKSSN